MAREGIGYFLLIVILGGKHYFFLSLYTFYFFVKIKNFCMQEKSTITAKTKLSKSTEK